MPLPDKLQKQGILQPIGRRNFLAFSGLTVASAALLLSGCNNDDDDATPMAGNTTITDDDIGVLNYAYALEQLEAAFYTKVVAEGFFSASGGADMSEKNLLKDIRDHEVAHRDLFAAALGSKKLRDLEVDFGSVNFNDRLSVLQTAKTFEDLGVSAYNGAGNLLQTPDYLVLAGKIVSVEARHAAYIRDLITPGSFAASDVVNAQGLDLARMPSEVLAAAAPFIKTQLTLELA